jgi:hypothetical protein
MTGPTQDVQVRIAQQVFVGGYLLPIGSFSVEVSPIQPNLCDVAIVANHPRLPAALRAQFEAIEPAPEGAKPTARPDALADLRVFSSLPGQAGPMFVEFAIRGIALVLTQ